MLNNFDDAIYSVCTFVHVGRGNRLMILFKMAGRTEREFPRPRCGSVMFVYDHQLFLWGGMTQIMLGEGDDRFLVDIDLPGMSVNYCQISHTHLPLFDYTVTITLLL